MSSIKLPLRVVSAGFRDEDLWSIVDADDEPVEITPHRADLIVAALEADAEYDVHRRTRDVWRHNMGDKTPEELIDRLDIALDRIDELTPNEEKVADWLAESRRAFTCPECGGHWFGTSGAGDDDRSNWVVHCHRQYGPCTWSGSYQEHVRNDHVEPNAEKETP